MKKKLLVLLIASIPMLMPNIASAIAIDVGAAVPYGRILCGCYLVTDF
jgi:hypothetical protein